MVDELMVDEFMVDEVYKVDEVDSWRLGWWAVGEFISQLGFCKCG